MEDFNQPQAESVETQPQTQGGDGNPAVAQALSRVRRVLGEKAKSSILNEKAVLYHRDNRDLLFDDLNSAYGKIGRPKISRKDFDIAILGKEDAPEAVVVQPAPVVQQPPLQPVVGDGDAEVVQPDMAARGEPQTGEFGTETVNGQPRAVAPGMTFNNPLAPIPQQPQNPALGFQQPVTDPEVLKQMEIANQQRLNDNRSFAQKWGMGGDVDKTAWAGLKRVAKSTLSGLKKTAMDFATGLTTPTMDEDITQERLKSNVDANHRMFKESAKVSEDWQNELKRLNVQPSVYQAFQNNTYNRLPEATALTVADAAMQFIPTILTLGGSTYLQTLPEAYSEGVKEIAKAQGISPEEVIASGQDGEAVAKVSALMQSALEKFGAGVISKSIATKGGYKAVRDWAIAKTGNKIWGKLAGLGFAAGAEGGEEVGQEITGMAGARLAASESAKEFMNRIPEIFTDPANRDRLLESFTAGSVGGAGLVSAGRAMSSQPEDLIPGDAGYKEEQAKQTTAPPPPQTPPPTGRDQQAPPAQKPVPAESNGFSDEQKQEYTQRGFELNGNGIYIHKGTHPAIKKVLDGWVGKLFAANGGTHAGSIDKEGSGIAGSLGKFKFKTGETPFLDLVFAKDKTDSDYFVTLSHEMGHGLFERLTPEEKAIIEQNQNLTESATAHKDNRENNGGLPENSASDAEESWSDYVSSFLAKKLFDVANE